MTDDTAERGILVDASVAITLSNIGCFELLRELRGEILMPQTVVDEIEDEPARTTLAGAVGDWIRVLSSERYPDEYQDTARAQLAADDQTGDVALLTCALIPKETSSKTAVVVTDDKPLRQTCKALSISVSGSIGVLIRAVERGAVDPDDAIDHLYAMDEVGARMSASLLSRAEKLIRDAE